MQSLMYCTLYCAISGIKRSMWKMFLDCANRFLRCSKSDKEPTALLNSVRGRLAHTLTFGLIKGLLPTCSSLLPQQIPL